MPETREVIAIVANPNPRDPADTGRVTIGRYTLEDDLITMVDGNDKPFRGRSGERVTHKLQPGEDPGIIAKRLTLQIHRSRRGDGMAGFNGPLNYRPVGIA